MSRFWGRENNFYSNYEQQFASKTTHAAMVKNYCSKSEEVGFSMQWTKKERLHLLTPGVRVPTNNWEAPAWGSQVCDMF